MSETIIYISKLTMYLLLDRFMGCEKSMGIEGGKLINIDQRINAQVIIVAATMTSLLYICRDNLGQFLSINIHNIITIAVHLAINKALILSAFLGTALVISSYWVSHSVIPYMVLVAGTFPAATLAITKSYESPETESKHRTGLSYEHNLQLTHMIQIYPDPALASDIDRKIVAWNRSMEIMTGIKSVDAIGKHRYTLSDSLLALGRLSLADMLDEQDHDLSSLYEDVIVGRDEISLEMSGVFIADGPEATFKCRARRAYDEKGELIGTIETMKDITDYRDTVKRLENTRSVLSTVLKMTGNGILATDKNGRMLECNDQFTAIWSLPAIAAGEEGQSWLVISEDILAKTKDPLNYFRTTYNCCLSQQGSCSDMVELKDGRILERKSMPVMINGAFAGRVWSFCEKTLKNIVREAPFSRVDKNNMIKEMHHRVKNNLQIISSLHSLQSRQISDRRMQNLYKECQSRLKSMALIYDHIIISDDSVSMNAQEYIKILTSYIYSSYNISMARVALKMNIAPTNMSVDTATPCGLIINELVGNSLKHAFPGDMKGEITIEMSSSENMITLLIRDNGIGFPRDINYRNPSSLGMQIVNCLVEQLNGTIHLQKEPGTAFVIKFLNSNTDQ